MNEWKKQWPSWIAMGAICVVLVAWCATGIYGWSKSAEGWMAYVAVALTVGAAAFALVSVKLAAGADDWGRRIALLGLGGGCLMFSAYAGHQGLEASENERWKGFEAYSANANAIAAVQAKIDALPMAPATVPKVRVAELNAARAAEIVRLEATKPAALPVVAKPTPRMPAELSWAMTALVEMLELFGFYAVSRRSKPASGANVIGFNAGRELAKKRWAA